MKITFYALHLGFGGVEKYVITVANMLAEEHDVEIISTYKINDTPAFPLSSKVKVEYLLKNLIPNRDELKHAFQVKNIKLIIKEITKSIKVLYLKNIKNIQSIKKCRSDVIISTRVFHNNLIGKYALKSITKIATEHNHHNNNVKYIEQVVASCKKFDYFLPISRELVDFYSEKMNQNNVNTRYIRFCIDENRNAQKPLLNRNNLITVGRLSPEKGMIDLVKLFINLHNENEHLRLHIVGDGVERRKIDNLIVDNKLAESVILHGFQDKEYIYNLMKDMSLYVMTSYTESFGIVLLEAMSCGIPCIAYDSAQGAYEIIKNGYNGWLIENRDEEKMKAKISEVLSEKKLIRELSENAFKTASEYSYDRTQRAWLELMKEIERKRRKRND